MAENDGDNENRDNDRGGTIHDNASGGTGMTMGGWQRQQ
jgi:hypothetical protein